MILYPPSLGFGVILSHPEDHIKPQISLHDEGRPLSLPMAAKFFAIRRLISTFAQDSRPNLVEFQVGIKSDQKGVR